MRKRETHTRGRRVYNVSMAVHLMVRSCYTMLGSTIRVSELAARAKSLGFSAVALTDHNVLHGAASFAHACQKAGIKPIFGMELDVETEGETYPVLLLARTNRGFSNLMRFSTAIQCGGKPVTLDELRNGSEGITIIVYGVDGWLTQPMLKSDEEEITRRLSVLKESLPPFDVALSYQDSPLWNDRNRILRACAGRLGIRTCAVSKCLYLNKEDAVIHQVMDCIRTQRLVTDTSVPVINGRHLLSPEELASFYDARDLERTDEIAASCNAQAVVETTGLPQFPCPGGLTSDQYLTQLCLAGLQKRLHGTVPQDYVSRLKHELDVITEMKFSDYFLIVYDFIRYARKSGIMVGPGRGSAAGSLVAYCLGITMVDPLRYGLLFERFLNPDRVSMPDIDTDIPDNRRAEVIRYVRDMYGMDHTANIVTFNTLGAKQVIRDVGKAMSIGQRDIDMLSSMIPNQPKITLHDALNTNRRLLEVVRADQRFKDLFRICAKLEGLPRHTSIHAAGIILSGKPLEDIIPLMNGEEGMMTSQYPAEFLEERGLIKMDFLGLRNLSMISSMEEKIRKNDPSFSVFSLPENDPSTMELFRNADTSGIFQFESEGMKNLLRKIRPERFEDIVAAMALFRPASTDSIPSYLKNRADPSGIRYLSENLRPVLEETYGVLVYQEQTMKIAQIAAGFTLAEADVLRKAMSKKKSEDLQAMQGKFVSGCLENGYTKEQAQDLFEHILKFGGYGFNKSHAVAYGVIAYQSAYLKARYPLFFYGSLIDSSIGDSAKISQYIDECRRRGIRVLPPDVNRSESECAVSGNALQLPLSIVKGIGVHAADEIIRERGSEPYKDFFDFTARASLHRITRASIENLIDAGALDGFMETRTTMREGIEDAIAYSDLIRIEQNGQTVLAEGLVSRPQLTKRYDEKEEIREREMNVLGFTLGAHPIIDVREQHGIRELPLIRLAGAKGHVSGFAYVKNVRQHKTKNGQLMAFVKVNDETSDFDLLVMPSQYQKYSGFLRKGIYILFDGKMTDDSKCIVSTLKLIK